MTTGTDIPIPVRFNPFKHHRNFILDTLRVASSEEIINLFGPVCNNYIDIYTGTMTPEAVGEAVISILKANGVLQTEAFTRWVAEKNGYRKIRLDDRSEWIVRKSDEPERYIHVHPARSGRFTVRFKGSTLKTVYLLKISETDSPEIPSPEIVNRVRIRIGLSPVKKLKQNQGILNCCENFFGKRPWHVW